MCCGGDCLGMTATRGLTTGYVLRNSLLGDLVVVRTSQSERTHTDLGGTACYTPGLMGQPTVPGLLTCTARSCTKYCRQL